jgi:hypothetical protein
MVDTTTPNLGLTKPEVGASDDVWGNKLNGNFDLIDTAVTAKVAKSGGTMTGLLTLSADPGAALGAATKQYVDTKVASVGGGVTQAYVDAGDASRVLKSGDAMIGRLDLQGTGSPSQLRAGPVGSNAGMFLTGNGPSSAFISGGVDLQPSGWIARDASVGIFGINNGSFFIYGGTGATVGAAWTPVVRFSVDVAGNAVVSGTLTVNGNSTLNALSCAAINTNGNIITAPRITFDANDYIMGDGTHIIARTSGNFYIQNLGGVSSPLVCGSITCGVLSSLENINATKHIIAGSGNVNGNMRYYFGSGATKYLDWDTTKFTFAGGPLTTNGSRFDAGDIHASGYLFADNGNLYLSGSPALIRGGNYTNFYTDGNLIRFTMGNVNDPTNIYRNDTHLFWHSNGTLLFTLNYPTATYIPAVVVNLGAGFKGHDGVSGSTYAYTNNLFYTGSGMQLWVDASNLGVISVTCDYRAKQDVKGLPSTWKQVLDLRPIQYTQKDFTPPGSRAQMAARSRRLEEEGVDTKEIEEFQHIIKADGIERWGFIAHELQETLLPSAASGEKDDPFAVQSPNTLAVLAAVTRALQEAMLRIEVLEGKLSGRAK